MWYNLKDLPRWLLGFFQINKHHEASVSEDDFISAFVKGHVPARIMSFGDQDSVFVII